jgi:hypothetical protein
MLFIIEAQYSTSSFREKGTANEREKNGTSRGIKKECTGIWPRRARDGPHTAPGRWACELRSRAGQRERMEWIKQKKKKKRKEASGSIDVVSCTPAIPPLMWKRDGDSSASRPCAGVATVTQRTCTRETQPSLQASQPATQVTRYSPALFLAPSGRLARFDYSTCANLPSPPAPLVVSQAPPPAVLTYTHTHTQTHAHVYLYILLDLWAIRARTGFFFPSKFKIQLLDSGYELNPRQTRNKYRFRVLDCLFLHMLFSP